MYEEKSANTTLNDLHAFESNDLLCNTCIISATEKWKREFIMNPFVFGLFAGLGQTQFDTQKTTRLFSKLNVIEGFTATFIQNPTKKKVCRCN